MEFLQDILNNSNTPVLSAFILGLMTAISPCPLATNITATAYISKDIQNKRSIFINGLLYTLGRALAYTIVGVILFFGASKFQVSKLFQANGEKVLGPMLIIIGIFMLGFIKIRLGSGKISEKIASKMKIGSGLSALILGILFALAFCPYSGIIYFGMLIPMTVSSAKGLYLPIVFAIATGLPVIIIAYLIAFTMSGIGNFYNKMKSFEKVFRKVAAVIFIGAGIYYVYIFFIA